MRRVHGEATECVVFIGRQHNACEPTGLDGTGDGNEAWRTAKRRKRPCVRPATFETGSCSLGGVWRTAKRRKRTSYGRNGGPVDREGCGVPQNGRNGPPTVEIVVLFIRRGVAYHKTGLHGILFISTVDLLQPPRATVDLLQPPRAPVHPASTARYSTGYCSTTHPRAPLHRILFIQASTTPRGSCSSRGNATAHCSSNPPCNAHCSSQRQHRSASVSSSSEGIARLGVVNSHRSIALVQ